MANDLDLIKRLLEVISKEDLKQVKAITDNKLKPNSASASETSFESFVYETINQVFKKRMGIDIMPFYVYKKRGKSSKNFSKHSKRLNIWLTGIVSDTGRTGLVGKKNKLLTLLIEIVLDDIEQRRLPLKIDIIVYSLSNAPELFNQAFPGYTVSGLASKVL